MSDTSSFDTGFSGGPYADPRYTGYLDTTPGDAPLPRRFDPRRGDASVPGPTGGHRGRRGRLHGGAAMAVGTLVSRATGFVRTLVLVGAVGFTGVNDAYNAGNTVPNIVYDLLLGGVLSSVVVPILVRAGREDADGGESFLSTLFTLMTAGLVVVTVAGELLAPALMHLYLSGHIQGSERSLAVTFTRLCLPQLLFYGLTALFSAVLTIRGRFGAVGFAPTVNNVVVIVVTLLFLVTTRHPGDRSWADLSGGQSLLLGLGTTVGVLAMTAALLPSLARAGVRVHWRARIGDPRLAEAAKLGGWVFAYAGFNQLGYLVVSNLATSRASDGSVYAYAYQLFQLPYAIVTVSVLSALMPGLSAAALDRDTAGVRDRLSRALRLALTPLVPAALGMVALATPIVVAAFHPRSVDVVAQTLAVFALGLPAFSAYQLLLRVFYARRDSRTPALVNLVANVANVGADLVLITVLPPHLRIPGLAGGFAISYLVGTALAVRLLRVPLGGLDGRRIATTVARTTLAGLTAAAVAHVLAALLTSSSAGRLSALVALVVAAAAGLAVFVGLARFLRVPELTELAAPIRGLLGR